MSHRLEELHRIADRVVVLRDGRLVADRPHAFTHDDIVHAMVGRDLLHDRAPGAPPAGRKVAHRGLSGT